MHISKTLTALTATACAVALAVPAVGQAWSPVDTSKTYMITTASSLALDISGGSRGDGAPLIQWPVNGAANQQWRFDSLGGDSYRIRNVNSGKCLTAPGGNVAQGTKIVQWLCGRAGQDWVFLAGVPGSRSGTLINGGGHDTGFGTTYYPALDVPGNSVVWGEQMQLYSSAELSSALDLNSYTAQRFLLSPLN
jgi:hypothetical protein